VNGNMLRFFAISFPSVRDRNTRVCRCFIHPCNSAHFFVYSFVKVQGGRTDRTVPGRDCSLPGRVRSLAKEGIALLLTSGFTLRLPGRMTLFSGHPSTVFVKEKEGRSSEEPLSAFGPRAPFCRAFGPPRLGAL